MHLTLENKKYKVFLVEFDDEDREKGVLTAVVDRADLKRTYTYEVSTFIDDHRVYKQYPREKYTLTLELTSKENGEVFSLEYYDDEVDDA